MDRYQEHKKKADKHLQFADHMISVTYDLVQEPKLLLSALENVFLAFTNGTSAILHYKKSIGQVPEFADDFSAKYKLYLTHVEKKHGIDAAYSQAMLEIRDILIYRKESPIEFTKDNMLIICSDSYDTRSISVKQIKRYLAKAKVFIEEINKMIPHA